MKEFDLYHLPAEVRAGLAMARTRDRRTTGGRLRVQMGEVWYPISACDGTGFDVPTAAFANAPRLRGLVEIHDGPRLIRTVLIVAGEPSGDTMRYDFKRATAPRTGPAVDYERNVEAPVGYLAFG